MDIDEFEYHPYMVGAVNEAEQWVKIWAFIHIDWQDPRLAWDPSEYGGVEDISIPSEKTWYPEFRYSDPADEGSLYVGIPDTLSLHHSGNIVYQHTSASKTMCNLDMSFYPFDEQECVIDIHGYELGASINLLNVTVPTHTRMDEIIGEWAMLHNKTSIRNVVYKRSFNSKVAAHDVPIIKCRFHIKRSHLFYIAVLMLPLMLSTVLMSLVFWIPPTHGDKIAYLVTIYLSISFFIGTISEGMPRSITEIPRLILFLGIVLGDGLFSLVASLFVIRRCVNEQHDTDHAQEQDQVDFDVRRNAHRPAQNENDRASDIFDQTELKKTTKEDANEGVDATKWDKIFFCLFYIVNIPFYMFIFSPLVFPRE